MDELNLKYDSNINVVYISDFIEFLNDKYKQNYINQEMVNISYTYKESFRNILSVFDNVSEVSFSNPETNVDYLIRLKNNKKYSILEGEVLEYPMVIIFKTLPENKDLIILDSIRLYEGNVPNCFMIKSQMKFKVDLTNKIISDSKVLDKIKNVVNFKPNSILNLSKDPYDFKVLGNNQIQINVLNKEENLRDIDISFNNNSTIIMSSDLLHINGYALCKTHENNLIVLNTKNKKQH